MAVTQSPRLGLTRWGAGTDPFRRAQIDADHAALDNLVAISLPEGTFNARPAAGVRGRFYHATDAPGGGADGLVYYDTGAAWVLVGSPPPDLTPYATHADLDTVAGEIITDHGALGGLGDDDHPQYFNAARGDARYPLKTLATTKGDLLVATEAAALARLGVGVDGALLTADAASAGGMKWSTPSYGKVTSGSYTGDAVTSRTIALPFTPQLVVISASNSSGYFGWLTTTAANAQESRLGGATAVATFARIVAGGFTVSGSGLLNGSGITFNYTAIG